MFERRERDLLGKVHARGAMGGVPGLEALAALVESQAAQILVRVEEDVVEPHAGREILEHLLPRRFPVEALLQIGERGDDAVPDHQQLAVEHRLEIDRGDDLREGRRDVVRAAREDALAAFRRHDLHADAVPFPLGAVLGGVECREIGRLERVGEHGRAEDGRIRRIGALAPALEPGEQIGIGRRKPVPDLLDIVCRDAIIREFRERDLGDARGDADAQRARDELEDGEAHRRIRRKQPARDDAGQFRLRVARQRLDHLGERRRLAVALPRRPDQRDGFGEIADIIPRPAEQHGVGVGLGERADEPGLGRLETELAGDGGEAIAAIGIGLRLEIMLEQRDLREPARGEDEALEQLREGDHVAISSWPSCLMSSSSSP